LYMHSSGVTKSLAGERKEIRKSLAGERKEIRSCRGGCVIKLQQYTCQVETGCYLLSELMTWSVASTAGGKNVQHTCYSSGW